jgi:hypothetical protein
MVTPSASVESETIFSAEATRRGELIAKVAFLGDAALSLRGSFVKIFAV